MENQLKNIFNRARIDDRQVNELIGLSKGLIADGVVNQSEAEFLRNWLIANSVATSNPVVSTLLERISHMLRDQEIDADESRELLQTLRDFSAGDIEIGELLRSTTLPLDKPEPDILIMGQRFTFTGTFAYGSRRSCEAAVSNLGGIVGPLSHSTNYLVVGAYATESWVHSAFGRKIEMAVEWRECGVPIAIISEGHWRTVVR